MCVLSVCVCVKCVCAFSESECALRARRIAEIVCVGSVFVDALRLCGGALCTSALVVRKWERSVCVC